MLSERLSYRIFDLKFYHMEMDEALADCIVQEDVPLVLQQNHDACGHFAMAITLVTSLLLKAI